MGDAKGHVFGWPLDPPLAIAVRPRVALAFRHVVDYRTGRTTLWVNSNLVFQGATSAFTPGHTTNELYFEAMRMAGRPRCHS